MIDHGEDAVCPWGDWGIAKSVKARDFDSRIRWFESNYPSHYGSLAQLVEHLTFNQGVPGSNPGWITTSTVSSLSSKRVGSFDLCTTFAVMR